ncbi:hypothetical protein PAJ34TS1_48680 [Paenibacillus azoreducens]|uniref:Uncharacterized protein n=1 Tax=Paenibacillus azoreducens TaxID=116718 RepID=A0A919YCE4_9BACL|nr:hypothetical protein J34TS1_38060 [Paenibacillus azoreducens]
MIFPPKNTFLKLIIELIYVYIKRMYRFLFFILQNASFYKMIENYNEFVGSVNRTAVTNIKQGETKDYETEKTVTYDLYVGTGRYAGSLW